MPTARIVLHAPHEVTFADDSEHALILINDWHRADPVFQKKTGNFPDRSVWMNRDHVFSHDVRCLHD